MLCIRPFKTGGAEFGCGQCLPCRINRRRMWTGRILLESLAHQANAFVTLTYDEEHLPHELDSKTPGGWIRELRRIVERPLRYFAVGEYGEQTKRPHYHAAVFGLSMLESEAVSEAWSKGYVHVGELTAESAQYIAGYVCKKMTARSDPRLEGRFPEFSRMSLRPGIGVYAIEQMAGGYLSLGGSQALIDDGDVTPLLRIGGRKYPLGRYMRDQLRVAVGWEKGMPADAKERLIALKVAEDKELRERKRENSYQSAMTRSRIHKRGL